MDFIGSITDLSLPDSGRLEIYRHKSVYMINMVCSRGMLNFQAHDLKSLKKLCLDIIGDINELQKPKNKEKSGTSFETRVEGRKLSDLQRGKSDKKERQGKESAAKGKGSGNREKPVKGNSSKDKKTRRS